MNPLRSCSLISEQHACAHFGGKDDPNAEAHPCESLALVSYPVIMSGPTIRLGGAARGEEMSAEMV